ncbi:MAG TPA: hypothetical protein VJ833_12150 [Rhodanobacteraceae bacterium]|nr:hypothetical protein [Rhodanobacteraceae bacterium]
MDIACTRTSGRDWNGFRLFALAVAGTTLFFGAAHAATVVTDHVTNQARHTQTSVPVTFGQVFKAGDVAKGETVVATLNGQPIPLQVDAKARNPDGSLRHAVLTALVPTLSGGASEPLAIAASSSPASTGSPLSLAQLLATQYDAKASLDIGGTAYVVSARALLQAAQHSGGCEPWSNACGVWLSGPLVSEWIVNGPVTSSTGTASPNLRVYFNVRAYAGSAPGSIAYVRTDIVVENAWAYSPQAQFQYTATLTSGSASYTSPALTQYAYTRWHHVLWWNGSDPQLYLQQDTRYIQDSLAVSRYAPLRPSPTFLAKVRQFCAPLDHCDQTQRMGNVGAQDAIGPLPRWTSVYIIDPDVRAYNWMLANTDALGTYPVHFRDQATGWPLSIQKHPYVTILGWTHARNAARGKGPHADLYRKDLLPTCVKDSELTKKCTGIYFNTGSLYSWSNAHQPAAGYVAYMVTGSHFYMEEMAFYASMSELSAGEAYRAFSRGLIDHARSQVRGKAWVLREMADAAWLLPDGYPLKAEFNADVNNSIADFNATYTNNPNANPLGMMNSGSQYPINGKKNRGGTPWQHSFLTWSAGHAADLGFAGAAAFRDWLGKFEVGLMTDWLADPTRGYCWVAASAYKVQVKDDSGKWFPNYTAVYDATFPFVAGLQCNSPEMIAALGKEKKRRWQVGEMFGYPDSATGYPANLQIGLATAVDSGLPNAERAWKIFESRSIKPSPPTGYDNFPNFAIIPRGTKVSPVASGAGH